MPPWPSDSRSSFVGSDFSYEDVSGRDLAADAYRGFWRTPAARPDDPASPTTVTYSYPTLSVYGVSLQRALLGGVGSLEAGLYGSREDESGFDPTVPNSQWRYLAGYQTQPWADLLVGVQAYAEVMRDYPAYQASLPAGSSAADEVRLVTTLRLTRWLDYQAWRLSLFVALSPTDDDYLFQPEVSYKVTDSLGLTCGGNLFGGSRSTTFFGQLDRNDNVYLSLRFDF